MKYKVGDLVRLKRPHSSGDIVNILEIIVDRNCYKIYIPYWEHFLIRDEDIIEKIGELTPQ